MNSNDSSPDKGLTPEQGKILLELARNTIAGHLGKKIAHPDNLEKEVSQPPFQSRSGTFVTINKGGSLRGCIGCLTTDETIAEGIRHNAINAAFCDPRFKPLSENELDQIKIEISVLTQPRPLEYTDGADLAARLRVNTDGVILGKGTARATFLPQVWEQLRQPADFLANLCRKAGLSGDAWKTSKLEISIYQVQHFEEE